MFNAQNRIRQLMAERGWTIYRLAQESKLSQTTISNIFKRNNQPSLPTVNAICDACGITLAQFFTENDIASYAVVLELNEIKQQQSIRAATKASKYNPEDVHINFFGGMEIISPKGTLTGEDIKADQCYLLLAYLILNHKKKFSIDTLAEIICPYDELDSPYKVVNNIVYRLRRILSVIGLEKLIIGKNGTFQIGPDFNIHTDFDRFEDACIQLKTEENPDMRHSLYHSAVDIYIKDSYSQDVNMNCG